MQPIRLFAVLLMIAWSPLPAADGPDDDRILVELPAPMRAQVLADMRGHLAAIETISRQLATGDYPAAAQTAESELGMSAIAGHGGPQRAQYMPQDWRTIGFTMHQVASRFAVVVRDAEVGDDLGGALAGLGDVMARCVACHERFRLH